MVASQPPTNIILAGAGTHNLTKFPHSEVTLLAHDQNGSWARVALDTNGRAAYGLLFSDGELHVLRGGSVTRGRRLAATNVRFPTAESFANMARSPSWRGRWQSS